MIVGLKVKKIGLKGVPAPGAALNCRLGIKRADQILTESKDGCPFQGIFWHYFL
jgi:hypothetical protein